ncbi:CRAL-TRIO domain-containing protein [Russula brevipes]|nr:CRAL-TRIO domain-containing protein [Russula brevipes]
MDADAIDASSLSSVYQPLDVLRIELQDEPAFHDGTVPDDDYTLTSALPKGRGYNASHAKQMILDCIHWRRTVEDVGIEELYRRIDPFDFPAREEVFESWPMGFHKTDKLGRPIHIQSFGAISPKRLYQNITPQEHWQTVLVNIEALLAEVLPAASAAAGRPIRQALVIVDLKGFGLSQFWTFKSIARRFFDVSQNYFPETMGQLIIINAPTSFTAIWSMIKPWLAPRTLDKITILGANHPDQHAVLLLDLVPPENLPTALGGTCTCTCDPTCTDAVAASGKGDIGDRTDDGSDDSGSSSSSGSGGGSGCALSNAGPWMDGRAERRARWLRGETPTPGVPWPPPPQKQEKAREPEPGQGQGDGRAEEPPEETEVETEGDARAHPNAAATGAGTATGASSPLCSRASVVGLSLPLPLSCPPPPPASVPLVV